MNRLNTLLVFACLISAASSFAANNYGNTIKVYKWVDSNGVTHYDQTPPANIPKDVLKLSKTASSDAATASNQSANSSASSSKAAKTTAAAPAAVKDKERCEIAKKNADTLKTYTHIKVKGDDGEFRFMSPEEQQQKIEEVDAAISESCE